MLKIRRTAAVPLRDGAAWELFPPSIRFLHLFKRHGLAPGDDALTLASLITAMDASRGGRQKKPEGEWSAADRRNFEFFCLIEQHARIRNRKPSEVIAQVDRGSLFKGLKCSGKKANPRRYEKGKALFQKHFGHLDPAVQGELIRKKAASIDVAALAALFPQEA